jgi:hypothetical protein
MADAHEGEPHDGARNEPQLPVVWSPKLDATRDCAEETAASAEDVIANEPADDNAAGATSEPHASPARSMRFALLAASVAVAAALGSFVGALSATGIAHVWPHTDVAAASAVNSASVAHIEFSALKTDVAGAARNATAQFAKLADRLDHLEQAQGEPAAKLARITDLLEKLEKKNAVASAAAPVETTGSIPSPPPNSEAKRTDRILQDWTVQSTQGGHVVVASRYNGVFEVVAGAVLPGVGRVETIKHQDGQWVVVTEHGLIVER